MAKLYYWSGANWYDSNSIAHQETGISTVNQATTNAIIFALLVLRGLVNYFGQVQKFNEILMASSSSSLLHTIQVDTNSILDGYKISRLTNDEKCI